MNYYSVHLQLANIDVQEISTIKNFVETLYSQCFLSFSFFATTDTDEWNKQ